MEGGRGRDGDMDNNEYLNIIKKQTLRTLKTNSMKGKSLTIFNTDYLDSVIIIYTVNIN